MVYELEIKTGRRVEFIDVTPRIQALVEEKGLKDGACMVYIPHTTAGVTINENADPSVIADIEASLERMVPEGAGYGHAEGNAPAHVKASLVGSSVSVAVEKGKLLLGTWQGIFFCEFDGPRRRKMIVTVV